MDDDTLADIERLVRTGLSSKERIFEIVSEEMNEPGDLDADEVGNAIESAWKKALAEQASWPSETDCDRLDRVFAALNASGVIALQDAGNTQSDGYEEIREALDRLREGSGDASHVVGYCFFHRQDLEHALDGSGLHLAFGPIDPKLESTEGAEIGRRVAAALAKEGFAVEWDGTFAKRILLRTFAWRRRFSRHA